MMIISTLSWSQGFFISVRYGSSQKIIFQFSHSSYSCHRYCLISTYASRHGYRGLRIEVFDSEKRIVDVLQSFLEPGLTHKT
jgi:hypothetical protein